ncbi:hypothetical protein H072_7436 [Dactylellina haptotyla CBS 200.50]|uniref:Uncharacterized protein n=1 Tax=Dactylellina haptotyla (strain CBS 200.50) TaxID=1284197 RepID=S8ACK2_DACHA|nr:hypothetical protein H072_7436 [Dactylellina haptotyla CBS 200.50]
MRFTISGASAFISILSFVPSISGHCFIYNTFGNYNPNIKGWGLGYRKDTPRGYADQLPYQQDAAVFSNPAVPGNAKEGREYLNTGCGMNLYYISQWETKYQPNVFPHATNWVKNENFFKHRYGPVGPYIPIADEIGYLISNNSLPQATQGGKISFQTFQINDDGAGPLQCYLSVKGDATEWTGQLGIPRQPSSGPYSVNYGSNQKSWPVEVNLPAEFTCQGSYNGVNNICIMKCHNFAANGPFGGCIAFQQMDGPEKSVRPPNRYIYQPPNQYIAPSKPVPKDKGPQVIEEPTYEDVDINVDVDGDVQKFRFKRD